MNNVKLMWGETELIVNEVTVDWGYDEHATSAWGEWNQYYTGNWNPTTFTVTGIMPREGVEMSLESSKALKYRENAQGKDFAELRKAGLIDCDGTLSEDGQDLLLEILADKHKEELVKFAKTINKEK